MEQEKEKPATPDRLMSLDALRGVDMFWIIGGGTLFQALAKYTNWSLLNWWSDQLEHRYWEGFNFEDMISPLLNHGLHEAGNFVIVIQVFGIGCRRDFSKRPGRMTSVFAFFSHNPVLDLCSVASFPTN